MDEQRATARGKSLDTPDETRRFVGKGKADLVQESCQLQHVGYDLSGEGWASSSSHDLALIT